MTIEIVSRPVLAAAVEASDQKQLELGYHSPARSTGPEYRAGAPPADDAAALGRPLMVAMAYDPEVYRAFLDIIGVIKLPQEVFSRPGFSDKIMAIAQSAPPLLAPGPSREELLQLVA
jgi:hypothetical protein